MLTQVKFIFWKENIYIILKCCEVVQNLLDIPLKLSEEQPLVNSYLKKYLAFLKQDITACLFGFRKIIIG